MKKAKTKPFNPQKKKVKDSKQNKGVFTEVYAVAPAPRRDYYALQIYQNKFIWTRWKISHGPYLTPLQRVISMEEFLKDLTLQNELTYIFGLPTTNLISDLAKKNWSLITMPSIVLQKIFSYTSVSDILRLSQVCKRLSEECSKNELWQGICKKQWKILLHNDIEKASLIGWKHVYLEKMRPKRYKVEKPSRPKPSILHRSKVLSLSTLNTPDSRISTANSNYTTNRRIQEVKKDDAIRSNSEIFGKEYKVKSTNTGKSTERTLVTSRGRTKPNERPISSGKLSMTPRIPDRKQQPSRSVISLVKVPEHPVESYSKPIKCKVTSIRTKSDTSQIVKPSESRNVKSRIEISRPSTGRSIKTNK